MKHDTDGSILVALNDAGGSGLYTVEGYLRLNTETAQGEAQGLYDTTGAMYAEISEDDTPANGTGRYTTDGWLRCCTTGSDFFGTTGLYGTDGSLRVTVPA